MDYDNQESQDYEEPEDIQDEQGPEIQVEEEDDSEEDLPMFGSQPRKKERRETDRSVGSPEKSRRSFSKSQRMSRSKSPEAPVLAKIQAMAADPSDYSDSYSDNDNSRSSRSMGRESPSAGSKRNYQQYKTGRYRSRSVCGDEDDEEGNSQFYGDA